MAAGTLQSGINIQVYNVRCNSSCFKQSSNFVSLPCFKRPAPLLIRRKFGVICSASAQASPVLDPVSSSSKKSSESQKKSTEAALILIRHGESLWNEKNLFTGCVDVPLTQKGVEEAIEAGKRISNIPVDLIYTSALVRAQMTAMLAMTQHRRKKVPIIVHNESEQAKAWSTIYSEDTQRQSIPVLTAWQLNERMYGELQGLNKQETADRFGKEKVHQWRRSYDIPPPNGESLEMCAERAVAYFKEEEQGLDVAKQCWLCSFECFLQIGDRTSTSFWEKCIDCCPWEFSAVNNNVSGQANFPRADLKIALTQVISLELSTGIPMLYIMKQGKFIRRGSPIGPTEAGVYAFTRNLALYRQKLDDMIH
eukprot:Gb_30237 [translate_table: standard]